jgi:hypothetical protein
MIVLDAILWLVLTTWLHGQRMPNSDRPAQDAAMTPSCLILAEARSARDRERSRRRDRPAATPLTKEPHVFPWRPTFAARRANLTKVV